MTNLSVMYLEEKLAIYAACVRVFRACFLYRHDSVRFRVQQT